MEKEKHYFSPLLAIKEDTFLIKKIKDTSIGMILYNNEVKCFLDVCPHAGAPVCQGTVTNLMVGEMRDERKMSSEIILKCPWHAWEFRISNGHSYIDGLSKLVTFRTEVSDGDVFVYL